jgi:hypothetical protein
MAEKAFDGELTIQTALQLIRYDIPVLILGKSSIGKSYTLIDITKKWNLPHSLLYIGSEKSENIEGVPKLTQRKEGKEILEYLQPYWFPNAAVITQCVKNGRILFERFVKDYWSAGDFDYGYKDLHSILNALSYEKFKTENLEKDGKYYLRVQLVDQDSDVAPIKLNTDKFELVKEPVEVRVEDGIESEEAIPDEYTRDDLRDFCLYLTTALGYGNYWLILDEIDKVESYDKDKFAPLLHIVRERTLKNFRMIDINNGEGLNIPFSVEGGNNGYANIIERINKDLDANESVLDTRVMAVANKTKNIEEALFRRFIQLIAEDVLIWRKSEVTQQQSIIESCLFKVKNNMVEADLQQGDLFVPENLVQRIDEINLQWQYNFLPKILNKTDIQSNLFISNIIQEYAESMAVGGDSAWLSQKRFTSFFKVLEDNYQKFDVPFEDSEDFDTPEMLFDCLTKDYTQAESIGENVRSEEELSEDIYGEIAQLLKQYGDSAKDVSDDIAEKMRDSYEARVIKGQDETTKNQAITDWTEEIISYMTASLYNPSGKFLPMGDVHKFLIPSLLNVFYTELGNDEMNQSDNIVQASVRMQSFFKKIAQQSGLNLDSLRLDKNATETAFYGATKAEIKGMDEIDVQNRSYYSLFGADDGDNSIKMSARTKLANIAIKGALPTFFKEIGTDMQLGKQVAAEYKDLTEYLRENLSETIEEQIQDYERIAEAKKDSNPKLSQQNYAIAKIVSAIILRKTKK